MTAPVKIAADATDVHEWSDKTHGDVHFRSLVDADFAPSSGIVQGIGSLAPGREERAHRHDLPETVYVLSGSGTARLGDRDIELSVGDTVYVPPGVIHAWTGGALGMKFLYSFPADRLADVTYDYGVREDIAAE